MVVMVLSKIGHELSRRVIGSTLAGDGLLVRLRSTSIGLLGLVAAVGLALVGFVSSQGWPEILNSPLPATPPKVSAVHDAVALRPPGSTQRARAVNGRGGGPVSAQGRRGGGLPSGSGGRGEQIHAAHRLAGPAAASPPAPPSQPAPAPTPSPAAPPSSSPAGEAESAPAPVPASTAPVAAVTDPSQSKSRPHDAGSTTTGHGGSESAGHSNAPAKSKSRASTAAQPGHVPVPPAETAAQDAPPAANDGSASEQHGNGHAYGKSGKGKD